MIKYFILLLLSSTAIFANPSVPPLPSLNSTTQWYQSGQANQPTFSCPASSKDEDYCDTCHGNIPGLNFFEDFKKTYCSLSQKVEYQYPSDLNECYESQNLAGNSAYEVCSCLGNEMMRDPQKYPALPESHTKHAIKNLAGGAIVKAVESATRARSYFSKVLAQNGKSAECNIFAEIRQKVESNQCGVYNATIKAALDADHKIGLPDTIDETFLNNYLNTIKLPVGLNPLDQTDPRNQFLQFQELLEYAHLNGHIREYSRIQEDIGQLQQSINGAIERQQFLVENFSANNSAFNSNIKFAAAHFCQTSSRELLDACKIGSENSAENAPKQLLADSRFQTHAFQYQSGGRNETIHNLAANNFSTQERARFILPGVLLLCQSFKDNLIDNNIACIAGDDTDINTRRSCAKLNQQKRMMCHSILNMFGKPRYSYIKTVLDKNFKPNMTREQLEAILMPDGHNCEVTGEAGVIYDLLISRINKKFSYIEGEGIDVTGAIAENSTVNSIIPETADPVIPEESTFEDETIHTLPVGEPTISIPMRPEESTAEITSAEPFIPVFDPNYTTPIDSELHNNATTETADDFIPNDQSSDSELARIMAKIDEINKNLADNEKKIEEVDQQIATTPNIRSDEKERLEIEKIRLQNEQLRLQIDQQRLEAAADKKQAQLEEAKRIEKQAADKKEAEGFKNQEALGARTATDQDTVTSSEKTIIPSKVGIPASSQSSNASDKATRATVDAQNGFTLSGVYVSSADEVSEFLAGNKTYRKHKIILDDPQNGENVIVCILPPDALDAAVKNKKQEFTYEDYLCGDPVKKEEVEEIDIATSKKVEKKQAPKEAEAPAKEIIKPGARFQSVKDIINEIDTK